MGSTPSVAQGSHGRDGGWRRFSPASRGACLSHRSAAALYGIGQEKLWVRNTQATIHLIEVTVTRRGEHHRDGIEVRMRPSLPSKDVGTRDGLPVTSPVRTLLDYATLEPPNRIERAVNEAAT